jgi:Uma2 family endonuclease
MRSLAEAPRQPYTTCAAEGLPRRAFTVREVERMVAAGLIEEDERIELIGGELVPMSPKGIRHEVLKAALLRLWYKAVPDGLGLVPETTFRLSTDTYLEPDIAVYRQADGLEKLKGDTALLVVEIADASLSYDKGRKANLYARFGVQELWVIDAAKMVLWVYRDPLYNGYRTITEYSAGDEVQPLASPALALTLAKLDLR